MPLDFAGGLNMTTHVCDLCKKPIDGQPIVRMKTRGYVKVRTELHPTCDRILEAFDLRVAIQAKERLQQHAFKMEHHYCWDILDRQIKRLRTQLRKACKGCDGSLCPICWGKP